MKRSVESLLTIGAGIAGLLAFAAPFYIGSGLLHWNSPHAQYVLGAIAFVLVLGVVALAPRVHRAVAGGGMPRITETERLRRAAEQQAQVEALASDPRWRLWADLIRNRRATDSALVEGWERRYRQLLADPKRKAWAEQALRGFFPGDREIDYRDDPAMRLTCEHLRPVENALRNSGFSCWPRENKRDISTQALLDFAGLQAMFHFQECVAWAARFDSRDPHSAPNDCLECKQCRSSIESGAGRRFPG